MVQLSVFGSVDLRGADGEALDAVLRQPKRFALLAYLALAGSPGGFVRRDRLLGVFWPDQDLKRARTSLRQALTFLRRALGPDLISRRGGEGVALNPEYLSCDAWDFQRLLEAGSLAEALEHYTGPLLGGFVLSGLPEFERWVESRREALHTRAVAVARDLSSRLLEDGRPRDAATWGKRALTLGGYDELGVEHGMRLLAATGDRVGALKVYQGLEEALSSQYGMTPSPSLMDLAEQIRAGVVPEAPPSSRWSSQNVEGTPDAGPPRADDDRRSGVDRRSKDRRRRSD